MNAVIEETAPESARDAITRLFAKQLREGYTISGAHAYNDADGAELFRMARLQHPTREKILRPIHRNGSGIYVMGRPERPANGWRLYRVAELLAADPTAPVYVVEGETCADASAKLVLNVTTSGSASSADAADWTPLRGRSVIVWPDHDKAGSKYADDVVRVLHSLGCTVRMIAPAIVEALPDKGDVVDWLALHPNATAADVLALETVEGDSRISSIRGIRTAPEPLRRPMPPAGEYPLDALGSLLGNAAKRIHAVVQAPAGLCGQSVLAAASLVVQSHADVSLSGTIEPLSLWHVSIGASGERKTATDHWALHAHAEFERAEAEAWRPELADHEIEMSAWRAAERIASQSGKGKGAEAIRKALHDLGAPPDEPLLPWLLLSEPTMEGLHKAFQFGRPGIGLFNDDAGDFIGGHAMNKDNRTKSAAGFSKLWDNGRFDRVRAGDGAAKYYGRRLALHLMMQPVIAEDVLSNPVLTQQGFLARCLMAWPTSTIGTREYQDVDLSTDPDLMRYWQRMRGLLERKPILREGTRNELQPRVLMLAPDAMVFWIEVKNAIEKAMTADYAGIHAWASKGGSQAARIAGVLTLVENPDAGIIQQETVERATELVLHHLDEAARIVGTASVPTAIKHAELLRGWCWDTGRTLLYSSDALRNGPNAIRTADAFNKAVEQLELTGWAEYLKDGIDIEGKHRRNVWNIRQEADA